MDKMIKKRQTIKVDIKTTRKNKGFFAKIKKYKLKKRDKLGVG